jgi:protein ImuB
MWIAVRFPLLPLEIFLRGSPTPEPFAVEERHAVLACGDEAAVRGVCAGMASSAALALVPSLRIAARDPAAEAEALAGMAGWAGQFTPKVALDFPSTLLLEVSGSLKLFRGLEALAGALRWGAAEMGWSPVVAAAPTPRAASWLAAAGAEKFVTEPAQLEAALASLPVTVLACAKEELETLEGIGVATLGELRALPRDGVVRRFRASLLDDLDRALGLAPDPRDFFSPPARFRAAIELPAEVGEAEALLFAARRLVVQLAGFLQARSGGVQRFVLKLAHRDREATRIEIGLAAPARDAERFTLLLRERLSALALRAPVRAIALEADEVAPLAGEEPQLLFEEGRPPGQWQHLVERLRARLGAEAVHGVAARPEHRPEQASVLADPGAKQLQAYFGERPFWLLAHPKPLQEIGGVPHHEGPLELLAGPERIESGWWDGDDAARDYFIARTRSESLVWIFRDRRGEGGWYLHGVFA